mmetsp:Transcript_31062/g.69927  ORF Transcript_31062/g.69927 Transcript_31062/m.69927 type:complete len:207 (+) Transcript_31062:233-853(+)
MSPEMVRGALHHQSLDVLVRGVDHGLRFPWIRPAVHEEDVVGLKIQPAILVVRILHEPRRLLEADIEQLLAHVCGISHGVQVRARRERTARAWIACLVESKLSACLIKPHPFGPVVCYRCISQASQHLPIVHIHTCSVSHDVDHGGNPVQRSADARICKKFALPPDVAERSGATGIVGLRYKGIAESFGEQGSIVLIFKNLVLAAK